MYVFFSFLPFLVVVVNKKKNKQRFLSFRLWSCVSLCKWCVCVCVLVCMYIFAIVLQGFKALRSLLNSNTLYLVSKKKLRLRLEGISFDYKLKCKMMLITNNSQKRTFFRAPLPQHLCSSGEKQVRRGFGKIIR